MANIDEVIWCHDAVNGTTSHHTRQYQTYCGVVLGVRSFSLS